jgi:iron complex transport system substrate-binding protein
MIAANSPAGLGLVCLLLLLLASAGRAEIKVLDDLGGEIILADPAKRIVSLAPHLTEIMFYLGIGDKVVGTVRYSDYPEQAREIPRVGDAFAVSVEGIVGLNPDLVIAWSSGGTSEALSKLMSLGIPVYFSEPKTLVDVAESAARIATLAGHDESGRYAKGEFLASLEKLKQNRDATERPRVFFQISTYDLYTINSNHLIGQAISHCGGDNIFGLSKIPVPLVSNESVPVAAPEIIIFSKGVSEESSWKQRWLKFKGIPAVSGGRLFEVSADLITRPGFRMLAGIEQLCGIISEVGFDTASNIPGGDQR